MCQYRCIDTLVAVIPSFWLSSAKESGQFLLCKWLIKIAPRATIQALRTDLLDTALIVQRISDSCAAGRGCFCLGQVTALDCYTHFVRGRPHEVLSESGMREFRMPGSMETEGGQWLTAPVLHAALPTGFEPRVTALRAVIILTQDYESNRLNK